jgi:germination protein M
MKGKKILFIGLFFVFVAIAVTSLAVFVNATKKSEGLMDINLYYLNPSDNTIVAEKRSVNKTAEPSEILSETLAAYNEGPKTTGLSKAVPDEVKLEVSRDKHKENVLDVELSKSFNGLSESQRIVCIGSIVYTFSEMYFIDNVNLTVDGENISSLYNIKGEETELLSRDNVINNPVINPEKIDRQMVVLYFTDADKKALFPEERSIEIKQSQTAEYQIVEQLMAGPSGESGLKGCMPQGAKIKDIKTEEGICYVNLSNEFVSNIGNSADSERLAIYSIVNSLTELSNVNKVQFLIEGKKISNYKGSYDFSKTFERDESLIKG